MLDIAVNKLSIETWAKISGLPFPMEEARQQAKQMLELQKQQGAEPDIKLLADANSPTWEEIMTFLKDDYIRSYKVDIETNSTLEVEATEDKQMVGEFMNAMAQFLNGIKPLIEQGILPFEAAQAMLTQISRRFRFGDEVEEQLKKMKAPEKGKDPEAEKAKQELMAEKQKLDQERQQMQQEMAKVKEDFTNQSNQLKSDKMQFDFDKKMATEKLKMEEKLASEKLRMEAKINEIKQDADQFEASEKIKSLLKDSERKTQSMLDRHKNEIKEINHEYKEQE